MDSDPATSNSKSGNTECFVMAFVLSFGKTSSQKELEIIYRFENKTNFIAL